MSEETTKYVNESPEAEHPVFTPEQIEEAGKQMSAYKTIRSREAWQARHGGLYAKYTEKRMSKQGLIKTFRRFMTYEAKDYFAKHTIKAEDILRIGIDKFIVANGWSCRSDVVKWRRNRVRLQVCPGCDDQFVPALVQQNHGLCIHCRKDFSNVAIRGYVSRMLYQLEDDATTDQPTFLVNFYALFANDKAFRDLFRKDNAFAIAEELRVKEERDAAAKALEETSQENVDSSSDA